MASSISQVLASGGVAASFNLGYYAAALALVSVAAISAARGYLVYKRRRILPSVLEEPDLVETEENETNEKLNFLVEELNREKEKLIAQNLDLKGQVHDLEMKLQIEEVLRRNLEKTLPGEKGVKKGVSKRPKRASKKPR